MQCDIHIGSWNRLVKMFICVVITSFCNIIVGQVPNFPVDTTRGGDALDSSSVMVEGPLFNVEKTSSVSAVSSMAGEDLPSSSFHISNALIGLVPGLNVNVYPEKPMRNSELLQHVNMSIRGMGTYRMTGNNRYKIYVDGFESDLEFFIGMTPSEIENISVLKDAASLSALGMNGAEGVLWITTSKGMSGGPVLDFKLKSGIQVPNSIYKPMDAAEYASFYNQAVSNDHDRIWNPVYSEEDIKAYRNYEAVNVDWFDEVLKPKAMANEGDLSFRGGNEGTLYSIHLSYLNQGGLYDLIASDSVSNEKLERYSIRSNFDFQFFDIFEAEVKLAGKISDFKGPNYNANTLWDNMGKYPSNIYPVKDATGNWSGTNIFPDNPVASVNALGWTSYRNRNLLANFGLKEKLDFILPGLYLQQRVSFQNYGGSSYGKTSSYARYYNGERTTTHLNVPISAQGQNPGGQVDHKQIKFTMGYHENWDNHELQSGLDYHISTYRGDGFEKYLIRYNNFSGRVHHVYKNRYISEVSFSYFGSDAFAPANRWKFYPSLSGGWLVSNESWFKSEMFNLLKIRGSVGMSGGLGNDAYNGGRYLFQQYYDSAGGGFYTGNSSPVGMPTLVPKYLANENIGPELRLKYNAGFELEWLDRFSLEGDFFVDHARDILSYDNSIPTYFGDVIFYNNVGKVNNLGGELSASYSNQFRNGSFSIFALGSYAKNTIIYMAESPRPYSYNSQTGNPIHVPIGLISDGFYEMEDFDSDGILKEDVPVPSFGAVQPGDLKYKDLNNDGKIDETDVTVIGNPSYPKLIFSLGGELKIKNFDFHFMLDGKSGLDINLLSHAKVQSVPFVNNSNIFPMARNAWAYYPDQGIDTRADATYPRLTTIANNNNYRSSDFWMVNGQFLRLRHIEIGYDLASILGGNQILISRSRVFISASNVLEVSLINKKFQLDPESLGGYPIMKSYNLGIGITL